MKREGERGSAAIEALILVPALLALMGLIVAGGRLGSANGAAQNAAAAASRAASLARDARGASSVARGAANQSMTDQGLRCDPLGVVVDTAGFGVAVGEPASVTVRVSCSVSLRGLGVPGLPGHRTVTATMTSPLDRYRGRT